MFTGKRSDASLYFPQQDILGPVLTLHRGLHLALSRILPFQWLTQLSDLSLSLWVHHIPLSPGSNLIRLLGSSYRLSSQNLLNIYDSSIYFFVAIPVQSVHKCRALTDRQAFLLVIERQGHKNSPSLKEPVIS